MRQFTCAEIRQRDALMLRDAVRPLAKVDPYGPILAMRLCEKFYNAILKMKTHEVESINVLLEEQEVFIINHYVSNEDWDGAMALLEQTWLVLYELRNQMVYPRPPRQATADEPAHALAP